MRKIILFICMALGLVHQGWGQNKSIDSLRIAFDQCYGLDVILTNGKKYFPDSTPVVGHPYWKSKETFLGSLTISGRTFMNQQLKYELNKQQFVLFYTNYNGQPCQIILNNTAIDSVRTGDCLFVPNKNPDIHQPFIQLISTGNLTCYIVWNKELNLNTMGATAGYEYTKDYSRYYLTYKGSDYRFKNKSSFLGVFNRKEKVSIRKYISSNGLKFKRMADNDLKKLIRFCEQTLI
ncbi:MAG TPA: hypothetical protein DCL77_15835 [Prolixibacteraceae bacterium]|nr:hypothetical protein [Prolixibacteraceae bacterium]